MELRHLRYFVAVAEELHFRRAAERLHVAQPAVSEQVRKLEAELGLLLLNRTHRSVSLTEAGAAMLVEARRVLRQADVATRVAKETEGRAVGRLRVGYTPDAVPAALSRALQRFTTSTPGVELALEVGTTPGLLEDVREGRLDAAAVCLPAVTRGLRATTVAREGAVAAVPLMHRFADLDELDVADLFDSNLLLMPRMVNPAFFDGVVAACREAGFSPSLRESEEPRVEHLLMGVALGRGIALAPASAAERYAFTGVRFVPLAGRAAECEVAIVASSNPATSVAQLIRLVNGATHQRPPAAPRPVLALAEAA
jgi:DNA-binding transcriptional LysR family regulator